MSSILPKAHHICCYVEVVKVQAVVQKMSE